MDLESANNLRCAFLARSLRIRLQSGSFNINKFIEDQKISTVLLSEAENAYLCCSDLSCISLNSAKPFYIAS